MQSNSEYFQEFHGKECAKLINYRNMLLQSAYSIKMQWCSILTEVSANICEKNEFAMKE